MKLMDAYKNMLSLGGLSTTQDDMVQTNITGKFEPASVKVGNASKRIVLPTEFYLKNNQWKGLIAFNPFNENQFNKTESPTMTFLRKCIVMRANLIFHCLAEQLLSLAASPQLQQGMGSELLDLMVILKDADAKNHEKYVKIVEKLPMTDMNDNATNLFIKKQGGIGDDKYARFASWGFPMMKALKDTSTPKGNNKPSMEIKGVRLNKKDVEVFTRLFHILLPNYDAEPHNPYYFGSNSRVAPSAESLIHASATLLGALNQTVEKLYGPNSKLTSMTKKEQQERYKNFYTDLSWVGKLGTLDSWDIKVRLVPVADGATSVETTEVAQAAPAQPAASTVTMGQAFDPRPKEMPVIAAATAQTPTQQPVAAPQYQQPTPAATPVAQPYQPYQPQPTAPAAPIAATTTPPGNRVKMSDLFGYGKPATPSPMPGYAAAAANPYAVAQSAYTYDQFGRPVAAAPATYGQPAMPPGFAPPPANINAVKNPLTGVLPHPEMQYQKAPPVTVVEPQPQYAYPAATGYGFPQPTAYAPSAAYPTATYAAPAAPMHNFKYR